MYIVPNLGFVLVEPPGDRTLTSVISCNGRHDYVMCERQFLRNYSAELNQIRYDTSILVAVDKRYAKSWILPC